MIDLSLTLLVMDMGTARCEHVTPRRSSLLYYLHLLNTPNFRTVRTPTLTATLKLIILLFYKNEVAVPREVNICS